MARRAESMVTLTSMEQDGAEEAVSAKASPGTDDLTVTENSEAGIFEAVLGGETVAGVVYSKAGNRVTLLATSVFPAFRGKGIAARLLSGVLEKLRMQGETVSVTCPFAAAFVSAHPEYADVIDLAVPGNNTHSRRADGH